MLTLQNIQRCGRCNVILTEAELEDQRYDDRFRCAGCEWHGDTHGFLTFAGIRSHEDEATDEWLKRVRIAGDAHYPLLQRYLPVPKNLRK